jgi:hypothetical protein
MNFKYFEIEDFNFLVFLLRNFSTSKIFQFHLKNYPIHNNWNSIKFKISIISKGF